MAPKMSTPLIVRSVGWLHGKRALVLAILALLAAGSVGYLFGRSNIAAGGGWFDDAAQLRETLPEKGQDGQNRARLDYHVEKIALAWEPVLRDEQMPGRRNGQKLCEAFQRAEQDSR